MRTPFILFLLLALLLGASGLSSASPTEEFLESLKPLEEAKNFPAAIFRVKGLLRAHPQDLILIKKLAALQEANGEAQEALTTLREARAIAPGDQFIIDELIRLSFQSVASDTPEQLPSPAQTADDIKALDLFRRALTLHKKGHLEEAFKTFLASLEISRAPMDEDDHGMLKMAQDFFALRAGQGNPEALFFQGAFDEYAGDSAQAEVHLKSFLERQPNSPRRERAEQILKDIEHRKVAVAPARPMVTQDSLTAAINLPAEILAKLFSNDESEIQKGLTWIVQNPSSDLANLEALRNLLRRGSYQELYYVMRTIEKLGKRATTLTNDLLELLEAPEPAVRILVVQLFAKLPLLPDRVLPELLNFIETEDQQLGMEVVKALAAYGDSALPSLRSLAEGQSTLAKSRANMAIYLIQSKEK